MSYEGEERRSSEFNQTSRQALEARVLKTEWTLGIHSEEIADLKKTTINIAHDLADITDTLIKIKYISYGAALFYVADSIGLVEVLRKVIGV